MAGNMAEKSKKELLRYVGNMQQMAYTREIGYQDGRAGGMKAVEVKSGAVRFTAALDKCMDIIQLEYKGNNLNFLSKPGLQNRGHYDTNGSEAQRSIMGGFMFTCGVGNVGGPEEGDDGEPLPMHGRLRSTPAEHVCIDGYWEDDSYILKLSGEMRHGKLFGENVMVRREIVTSFGSNVIHLKDEIENQGFSETPFMYLYHCNIGYPILEEGTRLIIPAVSTVLKGGDEETDLPWQKVTAPVDGCQEQVFYHRLLEDEKGWFHVGAVNDNLGIGVMLGFKKEQMPFFTQWKSMASGDYVTGLEPCNCHPAGRAWEKRNGTLQMLAPFEKRTVELDIMILDREEGEWA